MLSKSSNTFVIFHNHPTEKGLLGLSSVTSWTPPKNYYKDKKIEALQVGNYVINCIGQKKSLMRLNKDYGNTGTMGRKVNTVDRLVV